MDYKVLYYDCLQSTNTEAARLAANGAEEGTVVVCREQTAGRGQRNNKWVSNADENLTMSVVLRPTIVADKLFLLSKAFSCAVVAGLRKLGVVTATVKWPNDIFVENRKIAGILIEHSFSGNDLVFTVIGLGLNINQTRFPSLEIAPTSIAAETGKSYEINDVMNSVLVDFEVCYEQLLKGCNKIVHEKYMENLYRNTGFFPYKKPTGEILYAQINDVKDSGQLVLVDKNGKSETFMFKEISYPI